MTHYPHYPGPGSVTWKIGSETAVLLGGARAVLLQIAHPLVAMAVSAHSSYMTDPFGRADRTFTLGQLITFGPPGTVRQAARTINRKHTHVLGTLPMPAGDYAAGAQYKARDQDLLLWVHATLVDTVLQTYQLLIGPLPSLEQEQYYQESKHTARLLGLLPTNMPSTVQDLLHYVHEMTHSNRLAATPQARQLAQQVLYRSPKPTHLWTSHSSVRFLLHREQFHLVLQQSQSCFLHRRFVCRWNSPPHLLY